MCFFCLSICSCVCFHNFLLSHVTSFARRPAPCCGRDYCYCHMYNSMSAAAVTATVFLPLSLSFTAVLLCYTLRAQRSRSRQLWQVPATLSYRSVSCPLPMRLSLGASRLVESTNKYCAKFRVSQLRSEERWRQWRPYCYRIRSCLASLAQPSATVSRAVRHSTRSNRRLGPQFHWKPGSSVLLLLIARSWRRNPPTK